MTEDRSAKLRRVTYGFTLRLPASRDRVYRWATDYRPGDLELMGLKARRKVRRVAKDLILLTDIFASDPFSPTPGERTTKVKLVHLYPNRWSWTSTHVAGPAMYSQFLYELLPEGRTACRIRYTGVQVESATSTTGDDSLTSRARTLTREDSQGWRRFARAMAKDLA